MPAADTFQAGQWNAICDRCGFKYKSGQLRKEWTGLMVCYGTETNGCWEPRHPLDSLRGKSEKMATPWVRLDVDGIDVSVGSGNEVSGDDL